MYKRMRTDRPCPESVDIPGAHVAGQRLKFLRKQPLTISDAEILVNWLRSSLFWFQWQLSKKLLVVLAVLSRGTPWGTVLCKHQVFKSSSLPRFQGKPQNAANKYSLSAGAGRLTVWQWAWSGVFVSRCYGATCEC